MNITPIIQIVLNFIFLIVIFVIIRYVTKKWIYDASLKASYDALIKFEKDEQEKNIQQRIESIRNKYK